MPIDPRIALGVQPFQLQDPVTNYLKAQRIRGLQQQEEVNALTMDKYRRDMADEAAFRSKYGASSTELNALSRIDKNRSAQRSSDLKSDVTKLELFSRVIGGAKTPEALEYGKAMLRQTEGLDNDDLTMIDGMTLEEAPYLAQAAMTELQRIQAEQGEQRLSQSDARLAETKRHNLVREKQGSTDTTGAKGLAVKGYRYNEAGDLVRMKGGPADPDVLREQQTVKLSEKDKQQRESRFPRATLALKNYNADAERMDKDLEELINDKKGLAEITGIIQGRYDSAVLTPEGRRALALYNKVVARGTLKGLTDLRNASPTGAGLGQQSDRENAMLKEAFGALSRIQEPEDLATRLTELRQIQKDSVGRVQEAYDLDYEYRGVKSNTETPGVVEWNDL